jgi:plastocyanin
MKAIPIFLICFLLSPFSLRAQMPGMDMSKPASHKNSIPFELTTRKPKILSEEAISVFQGKQPKSRIVGDHAIVVDQNDAEVVVTTGPPEDMLSYRIQGIRNPTLAMKSGTKLRILFVNTDDDMHHDIRFGESQETWTSSPDTSKTVGTHRLDPTLDKKFSAEEITITASDSGSFSYFCSVSGHASGGMRGIIIIGNDPEALIRGVKKEDMQMDTSHGMEHGNMKMDHGGMEMDSSMKMDGMDMEGMSNMKQPLYQIASGTSWVPATTPMYGLMHEFSHSSLMEHGGIFPRYTYQSGPRGGKEFGAPNWYMAMYDNNLGTNDLLELRAMISLDAPIEKNHGYPLLLQTGEGLIDRQHPHDLFDELAVSYRHTFSKDISANIYAGLPGEPALGPPAFMHRVSAMSNPDAPLSHHWQDATHVTFGVATAGIQYKNFKIEGSVFNGREPDSNRYDIDKPRFDSYSGRLSYNPCNEFALQTSYGFLNNVEGDSVNIHRLTVSAIYTTKIEKNGWWSSTLVFGQNILPSENANSILFESQYSVNSNNIYGRAEFVQKYLHDLAIPGIGTADVSEITLGYSRTLATIAQINIDLGAQATYNIIPESLKSYYGNSPYGAQIYFAIHPTMMQMAQMTH